MTTSRAPRAMRMKTAALLLAMSSLVGPAIADPAPLQIVVRGKLDAEALRARIADELGKQVELTHECAGSCLDIAIAKGNATIAFTAAGGTRRERTVELGTDRAQWPLVITLLAGNLVRDEADEVLAGLPAPQLLGPRGPDTADAIGSPDEVGAPDELADADSPGPVVDPTVETHVEAQVNVSIPTVMVPGPERVGLVERRFVPEPERELRLFAVGFVPGLSTDFANTSYRHLLSLDALVGVSAGSGLVSIAGIADIERGRVSGIQLAGIAAIGHDISGIQIGGIAALGRRAEGAQIGGIAAVSGGDATLQLGGIAAVARGDTGAQLGGIAAMTGGDATLQLGGIAAVAHGNGNMQVAGIAAVAQDSSGFQLGGIASVARGESSVQVAGIASVARKANIQIAGIANVARELRGVQVAPINVAGDVEGIQVGIVNVGGSRDGFSFGLINIVPGGRADIEATIDSERLGTVLFRHGGRRWHNVYGVGGHPVDEASGSTRTDDVWMYGLGFGPSWQGKHSVVDLELMGWQVNHGARHSDDVSILSQLRLSVAYGRRFQVVAGGAINAYISNDGESPLLLERRKPGMPMEPGVTVEVWPSAFIGLRL
jgi:hypothetical protein